MYIVSQSDEEKDRTLEGFAMFNLSVDLNADRHMPVDINIGLLRGAMSSAYEAARQRYCHKTDP